MLKNFEQTLINKFYSYEKDWDHSFRRLVQIEEIRLGGLLRSSSYYSSNQAKPRVRIIDQIEKKYEKVSWFRSWFRPRKENLNRVRNTLLEKGRLRIESREIKVLIREFIVLDKFPTKNEGQFLNSLLVFIYINKLRDRFLEGNSMIPEFGFKREGAGIYLLLKSGASEEFLQKKAKKSLKGLRQKIRMMNLNFIWPLLARNKTIKELYAEVLGCSNRFDAFEDAQEKEKKQKKQKKKQEQSSSNEETLNPGRYQDALEIMEMSRVIDLGALKKKYKRKAMEHHPDRCEEDDKEIAHLKFLEIKEAYETLCKFV